MADKTVKINQGFRLRKKVRLLVTNDTDKRSFCRFKNEISLIINYFDKRAEELGQVSYGERSKSRRN